MAAALAYLATRVDRTPAPALSDAERLLIGALGFLGLAIVHMLVVEAPPVAIAEGVEDLGSLPGRDRLLRRPPRSPAGTGVARSSRRPPRWRASSAPPASSTSARLRSSTSIGDNAGGEARQIGQAWLSAFWTATGLGAVVWGMVRHSPKARLGGLALLAVAIAKVWTYDLSELEELARALSFVALGLLLLAGAFAYQRFKPRRKAEGELEERGSDEQEPQAYL